MDWLEHLFALNPDGGDGSVEAMIIAAVVLVSLTIVCLVSPQARALGLAAVNAVFRRSKPVR